MTEGNTARPTRIMKREHQAFLQGIMCKRLLQSTEVKELYLECHRQADVAPPDFVSSINTFITTINLNIAPFRMKIHKAIGEINGKSYFALINEQETEITRLAKNYSANEIAFFRGMVELVVMSENGNTSSKNVLNLTDTLEKSMSKTEAQKLLKRFEEDMLITEIKGRVSLSTLSILELARYFEVMFPEYIVKCPLCHVMVLQGTICESCELKVHNRCAINNRTAGKKCPQCDSEWPAKEEEISITSSTASSGQRESRKRKSAV